MRVVAGILLLVLGISYPMAMIFWLNRRLSRQPALLPRQVGKVLAFNGIFPVGVIALGLGLLLPAVGSTPVFRLVLLLIGLASLGLFISLYREPGVLRHGEGKDGRGETGSGI